MNKRQGQKIAPELQLPRKKQNGEHSAEKVVGRGLLVSKCVKA
jgi:hypothetical protein